MKDTSLAYSLVQITPDAARGERVNVGIFVFDFGSGHVAHRFADDFARVSKLGNKHPDSFLRFALEELTARVEQEFRGPFSEKTIRRFVSTRANSIRMSNLEPVFGYDVGREVDRLFDELVGTHERKSRDTRVSTKLRQGLKRLDALKFFDNKPEAVSLPRYDIKIRPDLGIRRGRYNLIKAARFDDRDKALSDAGYHVLAGRALHDTLGMQLVVVGEFGDQSSDFAESIREDLSRSNTMLYRMDELPKLAQDFTVH